MTLSKEEIEKFNISSEDVEYINNRNSPIEREKRRQKIMLSLQFPGENNYTAIREALIYLLEDSYIKK